MLHRLWIAPTALLLVMVMLTQSYAITAPATVTGGIGGCTSSMVNADANAVIFIFPDTASSPKPSGVMGAAFSDWTAIGILIGMALNTQYETFDTNTGTPVFINTGTGQPDPSGQPKMVTTGGPLVHSVVYWLEQTDALTPVFYSEDTTTQYFKLRADDTILANQLKSTAVTSEDRFVIYCVHDLAGNSYCVFYGFRWSGTLAAAHWILYQKQLGNLPSLTNSYSVIKWVDDGDGVVESPAADLYQVLASG